MVLGISTFAGAANQSPRSTDDPRTQLGDEIPNLALPLVNKNYCEQEPVESPFSIEIAALHQVTVPGFTGQVMSEAQIYEWYEQAFPSLVSALAESGAGYTRVFIRWFDIEPNEPVGGEPVFDWQWYDDRLIQIAQAGIKIIATIAAAPAWAGDGAVCPPIADAHLTDYQNFLAALVNRYSQPPYNIKIWEIFNEADNTTSQRAESHSCFGFYGPVYAEVLARSYTIIKFVDPGATVLMSGLAYEWWTEPPYDGPFYRYFADDVMSAGGASNFDALNFHYFPDYRLEWERWNPPANPPTCGLVEDGVGQPYDGSGIDVIAKKNHFTNRIGACFSVNKPVWLTETAEHGVVTDTASLKNQAYYVIKGYARGLAAGIENTTWYALATPNDTFDQGLLFSDLTPKPAFTAYQTLAAQLTNYRYDRALSVPNGEAYAFRNNCLGEKIVAWGNNVPLTVSPATALEVTDYQGNVSAIQDGGAGDIDGTLNGSIQVLLALDPMGSPVVPDPVPIPVFIRVTAK